MDLHPRFSRPPGRRGPRRVLVQHVSNVCAIESWVYTDENQAQTAVTPRCDGDAIMKSGVGAWLRRPPPMSSENKMPVAGLRVLCCRQDISTTTPFDDATFNAIHTALGIPSGHEYLTRLNAGACGKYLLGSAQQVFVFHRSNNNGTASAVLKHDSTSNLTVGYVLTGPRLSAENVAQHLQSQFSRFPHPLFVPTVLIEFTAADLMKELHHIHRLLAKSEQKTRFGDWTLDDDIAVGTANTTASSRPGPVNDDSLVRDEHKGESGYWQAVSHAMDGCHDMHDLSVLLGSLNCRFAFMDVAVRCSVEMTNFVLRELSQDPTADSDPAGSEHESSQRTKSQWNNAPLKNRVELLASTLNHMVMFGAIQQRMQAQQNTLFNLVAREDSKLNMGIARDSRALSAAAKRDSSAMKIIAILTTLFLPGTFVATLFAVPLFNWESTSMSDVMSNRFWIYWAVAAPLTLVVMGAMGVFALRQSQQHKRDTEEARRDIQLKLL